MYCKRKIDDQLDNWLKSDDKTPILLVGIRQCGKSESIKEFAKRNNLQLININFWAHPEYCSIFDENLDVKTLISNITLRFPKYSFNPNTTLLFFDEIQDCPRARLSLKFFKEDGQYKVISSGSFLGINGYIKGDATPIPVGAENIIEMKTMDFEEFLWANNYKSEQIEYLYNQFKAKKPIDAFVHSVYKKLFIQYACVSGFPKAVTTFIETQNIGSAFKVLNNIILGMKADFGRRKNKKGKLVFSPSEIARIENVYDLIPYFLAKENKRFIVSKIKDGLQYDKNDAIEYLKQAHIVEKVYNLEAPSLPLISEIIPSQFKLFPTDIGIAIAMYGVETVCSLLQGQLGQGKGAIYEALVFDSLYKANIKTYYYAKTSGLEIDFVIAHKGFATLLEAKSKNGNTKSSKTVMKHPEHYGKVKLIKIGDYNVGEENDIITIPHYLTFLLGKDEMNF